MFQGQFDLENQGQCHQVLVFNSSETFFVINTWFNFDSKIEIKKKVIVFTRNHTDDAEPWGGT